MKKLFHRLLPLTDNVMIAFLATVAIGFIVMPVGYALAQAAAQPSSTTIDLLPLIQALWPLIGAVLTALAGLVATRASTYFHLSSQDTIRGYVMSATQNAVNAVQTKLSAAPIGVDVHDAKVAAVASHLITTVPDGLKQLGFTLQPNDPKLVAMIGAQLAQWVPPLQPIAAIDVAPKPATAAQ